MSDNEQTKIITVHGLIPSWATLAVKENGTGYDLPVRVNDLRATLAREKPAAIYHDGERVVLCHTPGCNSLVRYDDPCPICPSCLLAYQREQAEYESGPWLVRFAAARAAADEAYSAAMATGGAEAASDAYLEVMTR